MSKRELVDRIVELNRSARREFLQSFSERELAEYLGRLESLDPQHEEVEILPLAC